MTQETKAEIIWRGRLLKDAATGLVFYPVAGIMLALFCVYLLGFIFSSEIKRVMEL